MTRTRESEDIRAPKRQHILDTAFKLFEDRGVCAVKVKDIARAAGVADGTIYLYFTDVVEVRAAWLAQADLTDMEKSLLIKHGQLFRARYQ